MTFDRRDYSIGPTGGVWVSPDGDMEILVGGNESESRYSLVRYRIEGNIPAHIHTAEDESVYVLDGEITVHVDDRDYDLAPGSFVFMPRGVRHAITVRTESWRGLSVSAPGGVFDKWMAELSAAGVGDPGTDPAALLTMNAINEKYGLKFLPPATIALQRVSW